MPDQRQTGILEEIGFGDTVGSQALHQSVVGADEGQLQASHEGMHVVAWIADQGNALPIAEKIIVDSEQQLRRIRLVEQVWRAHRATAVERFEVSAR